MRYTSKLKDLISWLQRKIYFYTLKRAYTMGARFVTHYEHHKAQLIEVLGVASADAIEVIQYPCPPVLGTHVPRHKSKHVKYLIYGQIREDKGVFEFLISPGAEHLDIALAGSIRDPRIHGIKRNNLTIIDRFIPNEELASLIMRFDFMLLPYTLNYTGGAGTLKDSFSFGLPVIASRIPIFEEVIGKDNLGWVFTHIEEIKQFADELTDDDYQQLCENCVDYARTHSWMSMRDEYFRLYKEITSRKS